MKKQMLDGIAFILIVAACVFVVAGTLWAASTFIIAKIVLGILASLTFVWWLGCMVSDDY